MTTRLDIFTAIAFAVDAGMPVPQEQTFDPATVWLRFDNTDDARLWARWHSPECLASFYTGGTQDSPLACYYGKWSDWMWSIVGRDQGSVMTVDGNDRPTVEQVTIAALASDSLVVPCPRCGHDQNVHEEAPFVPGLTNRRAWLCIGCEGYCSPVLVHVGAAPTPVVIVDAEVEKVPAHVQGWAIEGRAAK